MSSSTNRVSKVRSSSRVSPSPIAARAMLTRTASRSTASCSRCSPVGAMRRSRNSAYRSARGARAALPGLRPPRGDLDARRGEVVVPRLPRAPLVDLLRRGVLGEAGHAEEVGEFGVGRRPPVAVQELRRELLGPQVVRREPQGRRARDPRDLPRGPALLVGVVLERDPEVLEPPGEVPHDDGVPFRRLALDPDLVRGVGPDRRGVVRVGDGAHRGERDVHVEVRVGDVAAGEALLGRPGGELEDGKGDELGGDPLRRRPLHPRFLAGALPEPDRPAARLGRAS